MRLGTLGLVVVAAVVVGAIWVMARSDDAPPRDSLDHGKPAPRSTAPPAPQPPTPAAPDYVTFPSIPVDATLIIGESQARAKKLLGERVEQLKDGRLRFTLGGEGNGGGDEVYVDVQYEHGKAVWLWVLPLSMQPDQLPGSQDVVAWLGYQDGKGLSWRLDDDLRIPQVWDEKAQERHDAKLEAELEKSREAERRYAALREDLAAQLGSGYNKDKKGSAVVKVKGDVLYMWLDDCWEGYAEGLMEAGTGSIGRAVRAAHFSRVDCDDGKQVFSTAVE